MRWVRMTRRVVVLAVAGMVQLSTFGFIAGPGTGDLLRAEAHVATSATSGPAATASPSTGLATGQYVFVSFSGMPATFGVAFRQCIVNAQNVNTDCSGTSSTGGSTDANGNGANYLQIFGGTIPSAGTDPSNPTQYITCDNTHACNIAVVVDNTDLVGAALAPIAFAPAPDNCPQSSNNFLGVGASAAYDAIYRWEGAECLPPDKVKVGFTQGALDDYVQPFFNYVGAEPPSTIAFGVTGPLPTPPTPPAGSTLKFKHAPLTNSGLVLAYLIYGLVGTDTNPTQLTNITLTPSLIAQIMLGEIPNWNPINAITALNPNIQFPGGIHPFFRADASSVNYVETSWLAANAPQQWVETKGTTTAPLGASVIFPIYAASLYANGITGAYGLGSKVATFPLLNPGAQGAIAFMDSSTAAFFGLPTVNIERPDGSVVAATPATIAQGIADDTLNSDGTLSINYANNDDKAWPLSFPTYMLVPTNTIDPKLGAQLKSFLTYAVTAGQSNEPSGYVPLPSNLVKVSLAAAADIPVPVPPAPTPAPTLPATVVPHPVLPHPVLSH
ncbi:MAG: substrate-binding domain-containing protein, partial [Candidatus Dormibacteraeota bacterium]|nr:substrate-binding domain-containing protein [Candidatus Dormibacteraeota bacterium]